MPSNVAFHPKPTANNGRNRNGQRAPWYAVQDDGKPAKMPCGVHLRPSHVPADGPFSSRHYPKDLKEHYCRRLGPGEKHGDCVCDYYNFSELFAERQGPYNTPKTFRLMDLPSELVLRVFEQALIVRGGIEFCPEPYYMHRYTNDYEVSIAVAAAFGESYRYHKQRFRDEVIGHLNLLRVCKRFYKDAKPIFYGGNDFRFSHSSGWIALDKFLYILGMDRVKLVKHIIVVHPAFTVFPTTRGLETRFWDAMLPAVGLHYGKRLASVYSRERWFDTQEISPDPALVLEKSRTLRHLRLLLPPTCGGVVGCPVRIEAFDRLTVTFAAMEIAKPLPFASSSESGLSLPPARPEDGKTWAEKIVEAAEMDGWRAELVRVDKLGRYDPTGGVNLEAGNAEEEGWSGH